MLWVGKRNFRWDMDDRRRARVPWYLWRWRAGLVWPMVLFGGMAWGGIREFEAHPVWSVVWGAGFLGLAGVFARLVWRERLRRGVCAGPGEVHLRRDR